VDDGSRDDTAQRVRASFGHDPRRRLLTTANGGKAQALNSGMTQTQAME